MKITLVLFVAVAVAVCDFALGFEFGVKAVKQNCQCMPGKFCDGEINSDVQCHPSYGLICCIRPKPEPIPPYIPEESKNKLVNDLMNENVKEEEKNEVKAEKTNEIKEETKYKNN